MIWASRFDVYYQKHKYKPHKLEKNHKRNFRGILLKQFITQLRFVLGSSDKFKMNDNRMYRRYISFYKQTNKKKQKKKKKKKKKKKQNKQT